MSKKTMTRRTAVKTIGIGAAALAAPAIISPEARGSGNKLRYTYRFLMAGAPGIVAAHIDPFKKHGLDVEFSRVSLGLQIRDRMIAGDTDVGAMAMPPFLTAASRGLVTAICVESLAAKTVCLMSGVKTGIKTVEDLKGKTLATKTGTGISRALFSKVLPKHGLTPKDITVINVGMADHVSTVAAGSVDAMLGIEPFCTIGENAGILHRITDLSAYADIPVLNISQSKFAKNNPDALVAFMRGWLDIAKLFNSPEGQPTVARALKDEFKSSGYKAVTDEMMGSIVKNLVVKPEITPKIEKSLRSLFKALRKKGKLRFEVDWKASIRRDFMAKAMKG